MITRPEDLVVEVFHYWDNDDPYRGTKEPAGWSVGSGFVIGSGFVLTAGHNVGCSEIRLLAQPIQPGLTRTWLRDPFA
jgi:hypothetical protein